VASSLALIAGLLLLRRRTSSTSHTFAWWIGVSSLPALVVGGLLSAINERLLDVSILTLGLMCTTAKRWASTWVRSAAAMGVMSRCHRPQ